jgi:hypothetical protein
VAGPTIIDVPHSLGRDEARRRVGARIGELPSHIPGGMAQVRSSWASEHRMALEVSALGQLVSATLDVEERTVRVSLSLPPGLGFVSRALEAAIRDRGARLLLGDDNRR